MAGSWSSRRRGGEKRGEGEGEGEEEEEEEHADIMDRDVVQVQAADFPCVHLCMCI